MSLQAPETILPCFLCLIRLLGRLRLGTFHIYRQKERLKGTGGRVHPFPACSTSELHLVEKTNLNSSRFWMALAFSRCCCSELCMNIEAGWRETWSFSKCHTAALRQVS